MATSHGGVQSLPTVKFDRWTGYYRHAAGRRVIQTDQRRWDYKHQILEARHVPPWRVTLWVKLIELLVQARPRAIRRVLFGYDRASRHGMRWYARMGRRVWFHEWRNFFFRDRRTRTNSGPTLAEFWGAPQDHHEVPLRIVRRQQGEPVVSPPSRTVALPQLFVV
jgi:anaerobic magnesium-protoporphyrin IX monomethyl ester cyclase